MIPVRISHTNPSPTISRKSNQPERTDQIRAAVQMRIHMKPYQGLLIFFMGTGVPGLEECVNLRHEGVKDVSFADARGLFGEFPQYAGRKLRSARSRMRYSGDGPVS